MIKYNSKLLIIGASGHGKVVADIAIKMNRWEHIAFLDDNSLLHKSLNLDVIGKIKDISKYLSEYDFFVAIGNNQVRENIMRKLEDMGANIPVLIHPSAVIGEQIEVGFGTAIMAGAVINCCCNIGKGCIVNTGATLDHDNVIDNYVHISPGVNIAGTVKVGKNSWLGIGSIINNNITITSNCVIGAGAVVVNDIIEPGTYIGIPARLMEV